MLIQQQAATVAAAAVATVVVRAAMVVSREATVVARVATVRADTVVARAVVSSDIAIVVFRTKLTYLTGYGGGGNNWRGAPGGGYQGDQGTQITFTLMESSC